MEKAIEEVKGVLPEAVTEDKKRWYAVKFLENDSKVVESMALSAAGKDCVAKQREDLEKDCDSDMESIRLDIETVYRRGYLRIVNEQVASCHLGDLLLDCRSVHPENEIGYLPDPSVIGKGFHLGAGLAPTLYVSPNPVFDLGVLAKFGYRVCKHLELGLTYQYGCLNTLKHFENDGKAGRRGHLSDLMFSVYVPFHL